ncbi:hypothetical protein IMZ11_33805 [Microtetraspora sp. AC03309]|uniref:hypothetical protein n=1 Tax=Microtetraspora sp. AC03309 TaxID=2779376 RepID=UPI001E34EDA8|nr:hypothetical protein [Microtetraspora sp. AC03309]MCC5580605.1 hypothetical protein [Microtetraspora sp. AC03309]
MTATATIADTTTEALADAVTYAMHTRMRADARAEILAEMTPRDRRRVEAAIARHSLRQRTRKAWSTERVTTLKVTDEYSVCIYPGDHGGWTIATECDSMTLAADGRWIDTARLIARGDDAPQFATQADAVEALLATL